MRIALAQINPTLGDFSKNREKILEFIEKARQRRCDLVLFPEASLFGYHPVDLLERLSAVESEMREFDKLNKQMPKGIAAVIGLFRPNPHPRGKPYYNSAALLIAGRKPRFFNKQLLPTYDVFDDARHIEQGEVIDNFFEYKGKKIFLTICEDIWAWEHKLLRTNYPVNPLEKLKGKKIDLILNLSASPISHHKLELRHFMVEQTARFLKAPLVYVNMVGGQDELIFDGGSFAVDAKGKILAQNLYFEEDLNVVDLATREGGTRPTQMSQIERIRRSLVLGIRDFVKKSGFSHIHLGLSGGIDSAVVACLAADAIGPSNVLTVGLPGPFSAPESLSLAKNLSTNLGTQWLEIPIQGVYDTIVETLNKALGKIEFGVTHENLQARVRGIILMAVANQYKSLLLTTGNKDEYATGYATLYGDMCGALAPIADLLKGEVYKLAELYNAEDELIPKGIITRDPSAELRPHQRDSDSLPPYDELDKAVSRLVEGRQAARSKTEKWLVEVMMRSEFKRWQAPPILKISDHAFGRGRRLPLAHRVRV